MKPKNTPLLILTCLTLFSFACKKDNSANTNAITGKWQQIKLRTYQLGSMGVVIYDTTYTVPFTASDYIQFNEDRTCNLSVDHYYYMNAPGYPKTPQKIDPIVSTLKYESVGSKYIIKQINQVIPAGFDVRHTASIAAPKILINRSVFHGTFGAVNLIVDSYYTK